MSAIVATKLKNESTQYRRLNGDRDLNTLAQQARDILDRVDRDVWELGDILSAARTKCEDAEAAESAGYKGPNPNVRFNKWVSENFSETDTRTLFNYRSLWEVFADRRQEVRHLPQSSLYLLAQPSADDTLRDRAIRELPPPDDGGIVPFADVKQKIGYLKNQIKRESVPKPKKARLKHIIVADFTDESNWKDVKDNSVDLVFTDPPYGREDLDLYDALGKFCSQKLVDGGSLVTYLGDYAIKEVITKITSAENMHFVWPLVVAHEGPGQMLNLARQSGLRLKHKQLLWFMKGGPPRVTQGVFNSLIQSKKDKEHHEWQQGLEEAQYYVKALSRKNCLVVDPFCGVGTTIIAAIQSKRKCITFEKDSDTAKKANKRIEDFINDDKYQHKALQKDV